jgi:hypothetical protein
MQEKSEGNLESKKPGVIGRIILISWLRGLKAWPLLRIRWSQIDFVWPPPAFLLS